MLRDASEIYSKAGPRVDADTVNRLLEGNEVNNRPALLDAIKSRFDYDYHNPSSFLPYAKYLAIADYLCLQLYPNRDSEDSYEELGYRAIQNYFDGLAGQVVKIAASIAGPQRSAAQFIRSIRRSLHWGVHEFEEVRPGYIRYRMQQVSGPSGMMRGVLRACLEAAGCKQITITSTTSNEYDKTYEMRWQNKL